jgi:hypothetical protein
MEMNEQTDVTVQLSSLTRAVGQDGKKRPTSVEGVQLQRARIGEMITAMPDASDRQIAREIGCSPSTVSSVRRTLSNSNIEVGHQQKKNKAQLDTRVVGQPRVAENAPRLYWRIPQWIFEGVGYAGNSRCGSRLKWAFMVAVLGELMEQDEWVQRLICGTTLPEPEDGSENLSDDFFKYAPEIGSRFVHFSDEYKHKMLLLMCYAMQNEQTLENIVATSTSKMPDWPVHGQTESPVVLRICDLLIDPSAWCMRVKIDDDVVNEYAKVAELAGDFWAFQEPCLVYWVDNDLILIDGFHRTFAMEKCGKGSILAQIVYGTRHEAKIAALGANANHGLRSTPQNARQDL